MTDRPFDDVQTVPAATVVIFRRSPSGGAPELLMVQRAREMRFAGGAAVFPGGRVDPEDRSLAARLAPDAQPQIAAARLAGVRETLEETGLAVAVTRPVTAAEAADARALLLDQGALAPVLERFDWQLDLGRLVPFAHWCPRWEGAFDTRFFLTDLGTGAVDIAVDATENTHLFWTSAANAVTMAEREEISVIFPTLRNLERLAQFASFADACDHADRFGAQLITPSQQERDGETWLTIPDGHGYPVTAQRLATVRRG